MPRRIEPAADVVRRLAATAAALPDAVEEDAWTGVRWRIRTQTFAHVMVAQPGYESSYRDLTGDPSVRTVLTFHSAGDELLALTHAGLPFYKPPWSGSIVGLVLDDDTDWAEVHELVTDSYRLRAPKFLVRRLDTDQARAASVHRSAARTAAARTRSASSGRSGTGNDV
jgi:hypothetical protein